MFSFPGWWSVVVLRNVFIRWFFRTVQRFLFRRLFYCVIPTDFREKSVSFTICRRAKVLECVSILVNRRDDTAAALEIHVSGEHQLSKWPHSHIAMEPHSYIAA